MYSESLLFSVHDISSQCVKTISCVSWPGWCWLVLAVFVSVLASAVADRSTLVFAGVALDSRSLNNCGWRSMVMNGVAQFAG